ncbi:two-component system response regulator [Paenibacillus sp. 32O-W]|uniref:response regulator transcription factor n=1 Tax=Paenibacillus sp. 32O-W TaxID=1695218 RepID=UPI00071F1808|nr:response regulator transcription factor [Paenibacillus sp. 32O-W]ALS29881.1 two-component system response regulator [Paenibacillus sp. 32O-W]
MYKVLLVDDEVFVRKGLINLIDWRSLGFEICGEADNGADALEMMKRLGPDVVITDIRMPVLDGLELIRTVTTEWARSPVFIIVSGYHEFTYAQQALRYDVHDYILKPIDEGELTAMLAKLAGMLGAKKLNSLAGEKIVTGTLLETLVKDRYAGEEAAQFAAALRMEPTGRFVYALAELHPETDSGTGAGGWPVEEAVAALQPVAERIGRPIPVHIHQPGLIGLLLDVSRITSATGDMEAVYRSVQAALSEARGAPVTLYVGGEVGRIGDVHSSCRTAHQAMSYQFAEGETPVLLYDRVAGTALYYFDIDSELYAQLLEQLEENDKEAYSASIDRLFRHFREKRFAPGAVSNAIARCVIGVINVIRAMDGSEKELASLPAIMDWQSRRVRLPGLKRLFAAFMEEAADYIARLRRQQSKAGIEKIRKYIETHYMENISLKSIAAKFYMNSVYLGQLFRKTYGVYFNDYLLGIRIGEAKRLLRQTDCRMYEIAEKVGFQNADYFVTQFEKLERMTPTDYRNKLLGKK